MDEFSKPPLFEINERVLLSGLADFEVSGVKNPRESYIELVVNEFRLKLYEATDRLHECALAVSKGHKLGFIPGDRIQIIYSNKEYKHTNIEYLGVGNIGTVVPPTDILPANTVQVKMDSGREGVVDCHLIKKLSK